MKTLLGILQHIPLYVWNEIVSIMHQLCYLWSVIPPFADNELHPNNMTLPLPDIPPIDGPVLIEDDEISL